MPQSQVVYISLLSAIDGFVSAHNIPGREGPTISHPTQMRNAGTNPRFGREKIGSEQTKQKTLFVSPTIALGEKHTKKKKKVETDEPNNTQNHQSITLTQPRPINTHGGKKTNVKKTMLIFYLICLCTHQRQNKRHPTILV